MKRKKAHILKWTLYVLGFILVAVLQYTPHFLPSILSGRPLFLIPCVIALSMQEGEMPGAFYGVLAGLLCGSLGGGLIGFDALFLMFFGVAAGLLVKFLFRNNVVSVLIFTLVFTFFLEVVTWFFFYNLYGDNDFLFAFLQDILPTSLYTLLFAAPVYWGVRKLGSRFAEEE